MIRERRVRSVEEVPAALEASNDFPPAVITGLRVEDAEKGVTYDDGTSVVLAGTTVYITIIDTCFLLEHSPPVLSTGIVHSFNSSQLKRFRSFQFGFGFS